MIELSQADAAAEVQRYIGAAGYYHSVSYDTPLIISDLNSDDAFHHFELFDRRILWINPVVLDMDGKQEVLAPRAVIPCKSADEFDGVLVMNRLASLLCYVTHGTPVSVLAYAGTGFPIAVIGQPLQMAGGIAYPHSAIDAYISREDPVTMSSKRWIALAHFRQGIVARTPYYEFLSYWKIVELRFGNDSDYIKSYLASVFQKQPELVGQLHAGSAKPDAKLYSTRNRCAHFALQQKKGDEAQDPDDPDIYIAAQQDSGVMRQIAEDLVAKGSW